MKYNFLRLAAVVCGLIVGISIGFDAVNAEMKQQDFIPVSPFEDRIEKDGKTISRLYSGWKNWYDGVQWHEIDLMPRKEDGKIIVDRAPYTFEAPDNANEPFVFRNDGVYDKEVNARSIAPEFAETKIFTDIEPVAAQDLGGGQILYKNAFIKYGADLLIKFRNTGVEYLIKLDQMPPETVKGQDVSVCFKNSYSGKKGDREITTEKRIAYDSSPLPKVIEVKYVDGCKIIPWDFLKEANFPVYADDVVTVDSDVNDFVIRSNNDGTNSTDFTTVRNGVGLQYDATSAYIGGFNSRQGGAYPYIQRGYFIFDTGDVVPSGSVVSDVSFFLNSPFSNLNPTFDVVAVEGRQVNFSTADWDLVGTSGIGTGDIYGTLSVTNGTSGWREMVFNADGKAAIQMGAGNSTKIALVDDTDYSNIPVTDELAGGFDFSSGNAGSNQPYLEITFSEGGGSSGGSTGGGGGGSGSSFIETSTGSMVLGAIVCVTVTDGVCMDSDMTVDIPALHYFAQQQRAVLEAVMYKFTVIFFFWFVCIMGLIGFLFRILTRKT